MVLRPLTSPTSAALDWERVAFVLSSDAREGIMKSLRKRERTAAQLSEELDTPRSTVVKALNQLQRTRLVVCITPHRKKDKVYCITERGYSVLEQLRRARSDRKKR